MEFYDIEYPAAAAPAAAPAPYNTSIKVDYSSNRDYRAALRRAFYMVCDMEKLMDENPDYDEETADEQLYDEENIKTGLEYVYEKTKENTIFKSLYLNAAGRILSEQLDLGMTILFSYDHFKLFHECLVKFLNDGVIYDEDVEELKNNI
jgi:hypothetical protein